MAHQLVHENGCHRYRPPLSARNTLELMYSTMEFSIFRSFWAWALRHSVQWLVFVMFFLSILPANNRHLFDAKGKTKKLAGGLELERESGYELHTKTKRSNVVKRAILLQSAIICDAPLKSSHSNPSLSIEKPDLNVASSLFLVENTPRGVSIVTRTRKKLSLLVQNTWIENTFAFLGPTNQKKNTRTNRARFPHWIGPAIVRINLFVRSIATISDIKMVSV